MIAVTHCFVVDRILYQGKQLDLITYSRAELLGSDHRPGNLADSLLLAIAHRLYSFCNI